MEETRRELRAGPWDTPTESGAGGESKENHLGSLEPK